jgi:uroporphyrinogen decarboxylase
MNLFNLAIRKQNDGRPPVWFMRQAGRYHSHYQALRKQHSFIELCKKPEIACEVTMGPIRDFDFDAAILFSDLLFPLESMGMGLKYEPGPKLDWYLRSKDELVRLKTPKLSDVQFQADAMKLIRKELSAEKGLLGFVGGPLTLFCYAVEGSHAGSLESARAGITDGRFDHFNEKLIDFLAENMALQHRAGADTVAVLDTCAGEFSPEIYKDRVVPVLRELFRKFQTLCPDTPISYYSKGSGPAHWEALVDTPIGYLGIDWHHDIAEALERWGDRFAIQGNIDPQWLFFAPAELEHRLREVFGRAKALPAKARRGWICGLGHGVLPETPENNVRLFLKLQKEIFS